MADWETVELQSLGTLYDGPHATPDRVSEGPYFLNISSLENGRLDLSKSDHVGREDFARWTRRVAPMDGDLLFSYETRLGDAALMPPGVEACLGRRMALLRPDRSRIDPRFLLYAYLGPAMQRTIEQHTIHGATVNRIALSTMGRWSLAIPPLKEQRAIAEVLGALDDKIAANAKQASLADEVAVLEFRRSVSGVPMSAQTFDDVAQVGGGGTPSTKVADFWDGPIPWASPTDITKLQGPYLGQTARTISDLGLANCASPLYPLGSILMTSRATIGAFALAECPVAVNQGFIVVVPNDPLMRFWLFHEMRDRVDEFLTHANGATFLELSRGNFRRLPVRIADRAVTATFAERAAALHSSAASALRETRTLAATRDALLPALMSGKLRVLDAERILEGVV